MKTNIMYDLCEHLRQGPLVQGQVPKGIDSVYKRKQENDDLEAKMVYFELCLNDRLGNYTFASNDAHEKQELNSLYMGLIYL